MADRALGEMQLVRRLGETQMPRGNREDPKCVKRRQTRHVAPPASTGGCRKDSSLVASAFSLGVTRHNVGRMPDIPCCVASKSMELKHLFAFIRTILRCTPLTTMSSSLSEHSKWLREASLLDSPPSRRPRLSLFDEASTFQIAPPVFSGSCA